MAGENSGAAFFNSKAETEYSFYTNIKAGGAYAYGSLSPTEKSLYSILEQKVSYGGIDALNNQSLQSKGTIQDQRNSFAYQSSGERMNPVIVNSMEEAKSRTNNATFYDTDHSTGKKLPSGLYRDSAQNRYYFILSKPSPSKKVDPPLKTYGGVNTTRLRNNPITPQPVPKPVKPPKQVMRKLAQEYDLLFNALEYTKTYNEEIERLSMQLVESGDDILTNYNYESIDFLPDVDIEVRVSNGEYTNTADVFQQTDNSAYIETVLDESQASEDIELANKLITFIENQISTNVDFATKIKYYGSIESGKFNEAKPTENKVDFFIEIPDEYDDLDVEIRFDRI